MRSINKEKEESNVVILENSIAYFVILGVSKMLKKIVAIKKKHSNLGIKLSTGHGMDSGLVQPQKKTPLLSIIVMQQLGL